MITNPHSQTLGIFGPTSPQPSGIAGYIAESAQHLGGNLNPVCVVEDTRSPHEFGLVLYHLGNNAFHHGAYRALYERPGPVLLHEYNTLDYYYQAWDRIPTAERSAVLDLLGTHLDAEFASATDLDKWFDAHPAVDRYSLDARIESLVVNTATTVLVHHPSVADLLTTRYPHADVRVIAFPVAPIIPAKPDAVRARYELTPEMVVFATFGWIGQYKRVESILTAWQRWPRRPHNAILLLVGELQYDLHIPDDPSIRHLGWVSDHEFTQLLAAVDYPIQLRGPWLGETSGPATTLLAHRRPGIFSDIPVLRTTADDPRHTYIPLGDSEISNLLQALITHYARGRCTDLDYDSAYSWQTWARVLTGILTDSTGAHR
ncbi:glycosyltransferase [Nocardia uniformis]|uniref:Glycosyltransferase n=1 Tax=Nocardia uniformis TaxID=53432 RepID=A0A849CBW4_9NOCA|nr:glycosyltransferase [Nocardia uniformis]NNH76042.1 glycosyltransferase [Nocardia uniformis]